MATSINVLANEINKALAEYAYGVGEKIEAIAKKVTIDGVKRLKITSPKQHGYYAKSWKGKKVDGKWVTYNTAWGNMTYWLEKGHAKKDGGRVSGQVHIKPVEEQMITEFVNGVEEAIRG